MEGSVKENGLIINVCGTVNTPKKNEIVFNPDMVHNRSLVLCSLASFIETRKASGLDERIRCLDALGATGIAGLSWAKYFNNCDVTINDNNTTAFDLINSNKNANQLLVEVTKEDVNIILLRRAFDFVFLDCYGSSVQYLDTAFHHIPKNGVLVIHSTDDGALYGKAVDVTLRNYGGYVAKTFYAKELAARLILASIVRSAARCNKGIEVLCCFAIRSHITLVVRVLRGAAAATKCMQKIRKIIHCCICEDRAIYPQTIHPIESPYTYLSCDCRSKSIGQVAMELGPIWTGPIFDHTFCSSMVRNAQILEQEPKIQTLLQTIAAESVGGVKVSSNLLNVENTLSKKIKMDEESLTCPPFYFNLHRHSPRGHDLCKMKKIIALLQSSGFKACRTHFDPDAIRTSATLKEFIQLLTQLANSLSKQREK